MKKLTIDQYLVANCLYIIDEFNLYKGYSQEALKEEADKNITKWILQ